MDAFCTIITSDYFPKAEVLYNSLITFNKDITLHILLADNQPAPASRVKNIKLTTTTEIADYSLVKSLHKKYAHISLDRFRWSLKPVFASYLLRSGYDKIIYVDCDMFFVNNYNFLFDELNHSDILLTPNWNSADPLINTDAFLSNFTSGIFSAGFFGVNKNALGAMDWWANACHFMMGEHILKGVNDDQRYLDIFPVLFENTKIIRHRGCNIGSWNFEESKRTIINGQVLINGKFPVVFIHFDEMLASTILKGHDKLLNPYLDQYKNAFSSLGYNLSDFIQSIDYYSQAGTLKKIKWQLHLRTRLKHFFYKLAEKL